MYDEPLLPSPNQLKYKILLKNKKIQKQNPIQQQDYNPVPGLVKPSTPAPIAKHRVIPTKSYLHDLAQSKTDFDDIDNDDYTDWPSPSVELKKQAEKQNPNKTALSKKRKLFLNTFHKSQSLTDSAFHGLNTIFTNNKKTNNNLAVNFNDSNSLSTT